MLLGWPSVAVAALLAVAGVRAAKPALIWIALLLSAPMALYVSLTPRLPFAGIIPLGALVIAALTCRQGSRWPGIIGVAVFVSCIAALAFIVFAG